MQLFFRCLPISDRKTPNSHSDWRRPSTQKVDNVKMDPPWLQAALNLGPQHLKNFKPFFTGPEFTHCGLLAYTSPPIFIYTAASVSMPATKTPRRRSSAPSGVRLLEPWIYITHTNLQLPSCLKFGSKHDLFDISVPGLAPLTPPCQSIYNILDQDDLQTA
jgi:hypothetical protein